MAEKKWERKRQKQEPLIQVKKLTNSMCNFKCLYQAFLVGKDFGALLAYLVVVVHPEKVASVITLGIPFMLPGPSAVQNHLLPKGFYITWWQEPGRAKANFGRFDVKSVIRNIYILFSGSEVPVVGDDHEIMDLFNPSTPPPWFSEEDLATYASLYEKSGFRFALQVPYRSLVVDSGITDPKVTIPTLLIMGEKDYVFKFPKWDGEKFCTKLGSHIYARRKPFCA
ncbi:Epoxide hydrolase-like [Sesbania bispinosa]|nr:Epoxide hydrolase-like [Sesbania bispinosa]